MELHSYAKQCKHINRLIVENLEPKIVKLFFRGPLPLSFKTEKELTQKLYDFIARSDGNPDRETLEKIFWEAEADIQCWLLNLPFNLAARGMVDEAVKISRRYSEVFETGNFLGDLAVIFAEAGRKEEAFKHIAQCTVISTQIKA
ncbi:MAG TPA: hypothetical protein ENG83_10375 [Nitrospirae bacterium]|nr:hypothetical protein BMS3Abin06_01130 [bacterium BMS3Abin06]HDH12579.1 hypothetical protein [Nitrospirota bacterium]HDZ00990.1 hypothetical protein [Nitrospirota bacterium]